MFFGCVIDGDSKGYKARALDEKRFWQKPGTPQVWWNIDQVLGSDVAYVTEGELDACALVEAGLDPKQVLSVPGGAKEEGANYEFVKDGFQRGLDSVRRWVICGDADKVGLGLRRDLARLLGMAQVWFVEWPEGVKDANEMLLKEGPEALRELVTKGALPWPVNGLYRAAEIPLPPPMELWDAGFPEWEGRCKLARGLLSVVTGHGGHGKTKLMAQIWYQIAKAHGVRGAVCTMETRPKPHYLRDLRQFHWRRLEHTLTPQERAQADRFVDDHYRFILHPDDKPDLRWLLDVAEVAVVREGCRFLLIDPWNKLERTRPDRMSETEYIGQVLDELAVFGRDLGCHVQIVAHPSKTDMGNRDRAPELENIAGSKAWETKPDQGFVVWRPVKFEKPKDGGKPRRVTESKFIVRKSRFQDELGPDWTYEMRLNLETGCFESIDYETHYQAAMRGGRE